MQFNKYTYIHTYIRFLLDNVAQVDDDELQQEEESDEMRSWGSYSSHADSFRSSREMLQRRLRKRARAWRVFLAVMQVRCGKVPCRESSQEYLLYRPSCFLFVRLLSNCVAQPHC